MRRLLARLQDRLAGLLGLDLGRRTPLVRAMLHRPRGDAAGYWLQLVISTALATLGLALDSTAVVIGAMLIAPLMRPIVELAMGLATGSTPLVFRTGLRAFSSIGIVVVTSAAFAWLLPFHELTSELLARTAPSILDLFVAAACALAGAYAVVISGDDVASTAAGTSIGISLVPPLCTAGYGLSIRDWDMAVGAGLLFTANVAGIVIVASALFVVVGFGQVNIREEEQTLDEDVDVGRATRLGRVLSRRGSRLGIVPRLLLPLFLLGAVAYPLLKAVDSMSHRSSIRQRISTLLRRSKEERVLQYSLDQTARPVTLRVVVMGEPARARLLEQRLRNELAALGEPEAAIAVWAVSDATAVSALAQRLDDVPATLPPPAPEPPPPPSLDERIRRAWPTEAGGTLLSVWITDATPPRARLVHLGAEIGAGGRAVLTTVVGAVIEEVALAPVTVGEIGLVGWLPRATALLDHAGETPSVYFCVTTPPIPRRRDPVDALVREMIAHQAAEHPGITVASGERWEVVPQLTPCVTDPPP